MTNQQRQKAESAYIAEHAKAHTMLEEIRQLLSDQPAPESETTIHWGHVGDLGHVNELLKQVRDFLGGNE